MRAGMMGGRALVSTDQVRVGVTVVETQEGREQQPYRDRGVKTSTRG